MRQVSMTRTEDVDGSDNEAPPVRSSILSPRKSLARSLGLTASSLPHVYSKWEKKQMKNFSSISYHNPRSETYQDFLTNKYSNYYGTVWKWVFFFVIAVLMSVTAYVLKTVTEEIAQARIGYLSTLLEHHDTLGAFFWHIGISLGLICIASPMVIWFEPNAAGSGIPEVIGYLNGVHIPRIFTPKVYLAKITSVICSVASGLPLGPEGPMIHIGGTIGASVESRNLFLRKLIPWHQFRNQEDKRQFVLGGVASGVSAAFNAPIGGLAFSWEEISTFWEGQQAWMILFACMLSAFLTNFLLSLTFFPNNVGFFTRGTILFFVPSINSLGVWIFLPAIVIGLIGGTLGVIFTWIALFFARQRRRKLFQNKIVKLLEPILICLLFMSIGFFFPFAFPCVPIPGVNQTEIELMELHPIENATAEAEGEHEVDISRWLCPAGQHNVMANMTLLPGHELIKLLINRENVGYFRYDTLIAFLVYYFLFAAWCAGGVSLASGFVVPMITIGATFGRIIGKVMLLIAPLSESNNPGAYALLGSAAFFAGVSRLSISLTIIMIELSGDILMAFPLMVSIMVAKKFADMWIHSLYHALLALKGVPYLPEVSSIPGIDGLRVSDVMTTNVIVLHEVESIRNIANIMNTFDFSSFPIVSENLCYEGMMRRKDISILLGNPELFVRHRNDRTKKVLDWKELKLANNVKDKKDTKLVVSEENMEKFIDFGPYFNTGIFALPMSFFLKDAYNLFRTMALTHLIIVNRENQLVGVITRKDLIGENLIVKNEKRKKRLKNKLKKAIFHSEL
uniref:Chloride channel protein n=1 Tax=Arcella intermedia TaxID=1963864 RepID=A0A6B2KY49_9EUKA